MHDGRDDEAGADGGGGAGTDPPGPPHRAFVAAVTAALEQRADPERAAGQQRYMKSSMPYHGLTSPLLRATLGPLLRDPAFAMASRGQWEATIRALWSEATHREQWYAAIALARHRAYRRWVDSDAMPLWESLIRSGAWWDVVDDIATHLVRDTLLSSPDAEARRLRAWSRSDSLWVRRAAIISQVGAGDRLDQALLADVIEPNLGDRDFFVRKAIGWALRDHARSDPAWVQGFVRDHSGLSALSRREALRHIGEPA
jgi:3-methyladenine DNA glycosylase AlkD